MLSAQISVMNKHVAVEFLGPYRKWVRSFYLLSRRHVLVDFVPKGEEKTQKLFVKEILKQKTGKYRHHGREFEVTCELAKNKLSLSELLDYASLLVKGKPDHLVLNLNQLAPNQDWEPPRHLIPKIYVERVWVDKQVSGSALQETLVIRNQVQPTSPDS